MRLSKAFSPPVKTAIKADESLNYRLLVQGGFIDQLAAGVYSYLPLGLKVLQRITAVIREELDSHSAQEVLLPVLHPKSNWETTGRWQSFDVLYRLKDSSKKEFALGPTHEEVITPLAKTRIKSYRDLPQALYQIQTKFRDEPRPKSGLLRGREFLMKDLYSLHANQADLEKYYEQIKPVYGRIFERLGLEALEVEASGGVFSKFSHEFQVLCERGEDTIYYCGHCRKGINQEIAEVKVGDRCRDCGKGHYRESKAIEVGNIFKLGTRFSEAFNFSYVDAKGKEQPVYMGCYGIGLSRVMGAIVEMHHDERGIVWPSSVAPADIHLISLGSEPAIKQAAEELYNRLVKAGRTVVYDDREESPGIKFTDADMIGAPWRLTVSKKTLAQAAAEVKERSRPAVKLVKIDQINKGF